MDDTNPQSLNRYAYVKNNPTTLIDPKGLCPNCPPPPPQTCGHGFTVPQGQNPATWCYNHMGIGSGILPGTLGWLPGTSEDTIAGNDIFDAIAGTPGTYLTQDQYGNLALASPPHSGAKLKT